jgi:hypothetical protein
MSQISRVQGTPIGPKPIPVLATINVVVALVVLGMLGWAVTLNKRNKELEKKVQALEGGGKGRVNAAQAAAAVARRGQPVVAPGGGGKSKKRRRPATMAAAQSSPATRIASAATAPGASEPAAQPRQAISDAELARIEKLHEATRQAMSQGRATMLDVLRAQRLVSRAKFLHGDLTARQYQEQSKQHAAEAGAHLLALEAAGRLDHATQLEVYEQLLVDRRD